MNSAIIHFQADNAEATSILIHDEVNGKIFNEEFCIVLQSLAIERVQNGMSGSVGCGASALCSALAKVCCHATKGTLIDFTIFGARERHAPMFQLVDSCRRIAAQIFNRILIAEPV